MKVEHTNDGFTVVRFNCDHEYFQLVADGLKTAEARLLSRSEVASIRSDPPQYILLTDLGGHHDERLIPLSWFGTVGTLLGSELVLFCWRQS